MVRPSNVRIDTQRLEYAASLAQDAVKRGLYPGIVLAVANSQHTVWTHVVPGADGLRHDSIFQIASITKPIVATAIMQLVEQGKLLLHTPVVNYLPEFTGGGRERITAFHLLTHCSGLDEQSFWDETRVLPTQPPAGYLFDACCRVRLVFEPGTAYQYNSLSFSVLAELITRLSGRPYPEYLREHIFELLGMVDTAFSPVDRQRAAPLYDFGSVEQLEGFNRLAVPGGGLWSTAADLVAFGQAFLRSLYGQGLSSHGDPDYRVLAPRTIEVMTTHYTRGKMSLQGGLPAVPFNYALGWGKPSWPPIGDTLASERAFGHSGASSTLLWVDPDWDIVFVFLSNRWELQDPTDTRSRALNAVYGALLRAEEVQLGS